MKDPHHSQKPSLELSDYLEAKRRSLEDFLTLTKSLRDRLITQDWPDVEGLLKQRQDLIVTIDQMDVRIQELRSRQPLDQEWLLDGQKKKILSLLNNIRDLSEKAQTVDKECMDRMTDWQGQIKSQLSGMRDSLKAVHGYVRKPTRPPKFLDVRR
ncbi:MAG: hypothetical protein WCO26_01740 [Deltaproteobacteria bacterium]